MGAVRATRRTALPGFTFIEVMLAVALLGIVGLACVGFLTAFAQGGEARQRISDPAIESALAIRRIDTLVPSFRTLLAADGETALIWVSDRIASRSVHLSETAMIRFDAEQAELLLETPLAEAIAADRELEGEYLLGQYGSLRDAFDALRDGGMLEREILAEGIDSVELAPVFGTPGVVEATFANTVASTRIRIAPAALEEPLR